MECGQAGKTNAHDSQAWLGATPRGTGAGTGQQQAELSCVSSGGPTLHSLTDLHTWSSTVYQMTAQAVCTAEKEMDCRDSHTQLVGTWHSPHSLAPLRCVCAGHTGWSPRLAVKQCHQPLGRQRHQPMGRQCHQPLRRQSHQPLGRQRHQPLGTQCHQPLGTQPPAAGETAGRSWVNIAKDTCRVGQSA